MPQQPAAFEPRQLRVDLSVVISFLHRRTSRSFARRVDAAETTQIVPTTRHLHSFSLFDRVSKGYCGWLELTLVAILCIVHSYCWVTLSHSTSFGWDDELWSCTAGLSCGASLWTNTNRPRGQETSLRKGQNTRKPMNQAFNGGLKLSLEKASEIEQAHYRGSVSL
jgi:hypothetical protein